MDGTRTRAIQGHTLKMFKLDDLYTKIDDVRNFREHECWGEKCDPFFAPDHVVIEFDEEASLLNWDRMGSLATSRTNRFISVKPTKGTDACDFGRKPTVNYAYLNVTRLFNHKPALNLYLTGGKRIMTDSNIPKELTVMARRHNPTGTEIIMDTIT